MDSPFEACFWAVLKWLRAAPSTGSARTAVPSRLTEIVLEPLALAEREEMASGWTERSKRGAVWS